MNTLRLPPKPAVPEKHSMWKHVATQELYTVMGYSFNATTDEWMVNYIAHKVQRDPQTFTRTVPNFLERFTRYK